MTFAVDWALKNNYLSFGEGYLLPPAAALLKLKPGLETWLLNKPPAEGPAPSAVPKVEPVPSPVEAAPKPPGLLAPNRPPPAAVPAKSKTDH